MVERCLGLAQMRISEREAQRPDELGGASFDLGEYRARLVRLLAGRQRVRQHEEIERPTPREVHAIAECGDGLVGLSCLGADETVGEGAVRGGRIQVTETAAIGKRLV